MIRSPPPINVTADASVAIGESKLDDDEYDYYHQHHHLNQIMSNSTNTSGSTSSMKPPPQPATAAVNSIHWDVEEGVCEELCYVLFVANHMARVSHFHLFYIMCTYMPACLPAVLDPSLQIIYCTTFSGVQMMHPMMAMVSMPRRMMTRWKKANRRCILPLASSLSMMMSNQYRSQVVVHLQLAGVSVLVAALAVLPA
jgi:hypothetical protein